jgi:hypothetical protein
MLKLTLSKKTWKYIFYAVIALVLLYVVFFSSSRERFNSVNPIPTAADINTFKASWIKEDETGRKNNVSRLQIVATALKTAPESIKAVVRFARANVIPLLPYQLVKQFQQDDGDATELYMLGSMLPLGNWIFDPLSYAVKQQSSPPTLSAFIDMGVKIFIENAPNPPQMTPELQGVIDQMKKGETTIEYRDVGTIPNPGYWGYRYIYGDPKVAPSGPAKPQAASKTGKASSGGAAGAGGIGSGKCTPSFQQVPGGITETRCFN